jgi:glutathione reductase (NADPH)
LVDCEWNCSNTNHVGGLVAVDLALLSPVKEADVTSTYDVLIIGSGTAGQTAAFELNRRGLTVGLVEHSHQPGGTCALSGCQAKKWFYEGAETVARSRHLSGIGMDAPAVPKWSQLRDAKNAFTTHVPSDTVNRLKNAGIDYIPGRARFVDHGSIQVNGQHIGARFFVLSTGAAPKKLPIDGAPLMTTSSDFMQLDRLPRRILFVGGGFISFEFAHFAVRLGPADTLCTILEAGDRPLGPFDEQMVGLLVEASQKENIDVHTNIEITTIVQQDGTYTVVAADGRRFEADLVVHGAGRAPNIEDLSLDRAGVDATRQGILVNEKMETSNAAIYAAGDCVATVQLARVADAEAQIAAMNISASYNGDRHLTLMNYTAVPTILFTYPQYGMVGATERALQDDGIAYEKSVADHLTWPTYKRVGLPSAAYKLLVDKKDHQLLGAHIVSDNAAGLIYAFTLAMHNRIPVAELYRQSVMTPYPSRESDILYMLKPLL